MKPDIKEKWIVALTSGEFKQGRHVLRNQDGSYCCLGVLCELYRRETGDGEWTPGIKKFGDETGNIIYMNVLRFGEALDATREPPRVDDWAGINYFDNTALASMNDDGVSFTDIAEYIKERY